MSVGDIGPQGEASRVRILNAAAEIAAECGYEATTISKITKRSGLPASSVYWFFRDKDHLMAEVLRHSFDQWISEQPQWEAGPADGRPMGERLRAILSRSVRSLAAHPDFLRIGHMLLLESRAVEPESRQYFLEVRAAVEEGIAAWFATYVDDAVEARRPGLAVDLARVVIAATDGFFLADQIESVPDPDVFVDVVVAIAEAALAA